MRITFKKYDITNYFFEINKEKVMSKLDLEECEIEDFVRDLFDGYYDGTWDEDNLDHPEYGNLKDKFDLKFIAYDTDYTDEVEIHD